MPYSTSQCRKFAVLAGQGKNVPADWKKHCKKKAKKKRKK